MIDKEKMQTVRISNIQRFCLQDGPGIRTTVFLKGCSIHCPWCANPENIRYEVQPFYNSSGEEVGKYGMDITLGELQSEIMKDRDFYIGGGGVTFSGGEPLLQLERYRPLLQELKSLGIHLAVETALFVPGQLAELAKEYFDWFYIDMKILEPEKCKSVLGGCAEQYLANLKSICLSDKPVCIRIPCSADTVNERNAALMIETLKKYRLTNVELFNLHDLAREKYRKLHRQFPEIDTAFDYAQMMRQTMEKAGIVCKVVSL